MTDWSALRARARPPPGRRGGRYGAGAPRGTGETVRRPQGESLVRHQRARDGPIRWGPSVRGRHRRPVGRKGPAPAGGARARGGRCSPTSVRVLGRPPRNTLFPVTASEIRLRPPRT
ncbi:hypothetical protein ROHU_037133 [Labeo rohita]|uniref:Uncharacterized protein n=1 Tax=Labeo rohita TaxID=84645 RepID=A0A498MC50_LABRO|nr:hypothetical protein ROHU_037133 [Labeo rohita]